MNVLSLLYIMITLFLLLICGFACRKWNVLDAVASKKCSKLIIAVGQPMLIVGALVNAEYSPANLHIALQATLIGFGMHTFLALASFLIFRKFKDQTKAKILEFSMVFANCGFLGFPVLDSLFDTPETQGLGSFMGAFYVISFHLFLWTCGILLLGRGRDDIKLTPKKALLNFGTVPCAIGLVLYLLKPVFDVSTLPFIPKFLNYLGGLCTPISVLITGGLLATVSLGGMFKNKLLYFHSFLKLFVLPAIVCVLAKLLGLSDINILLCTVMAGLPSASSVTMMAELYDIEPGLASQTVGMTSLLTTATLPVMVMFAQWVIGL